MSTIVLENRIRHIKMMWFVMGVCSTISLLTLDSIPVMSACWIIFAYLAYRSSKRTTKQIVK